MSVTPEAGCYIISGWLKYPGLASSGYHSSRVLGIRGLSVTLPPLENYLE